MSFAVAVPALPGGAMLVSALLFGEAVVRGAAPERLLAGMLLSGALVEAVTAWVWGGGDPRSQAWMCLPADILLFATILTVALHANRIYPLWLAGLQLAAVACHFAGFAMMPGPRAHAIMQDVPFCLQLAVMALGLSSRAIGDRRCESWAC